MPIRNLNQFDLPKLIITEGEDDAQFIFGFLKKINESLLKSIHIHWVGGNAKLLDGDKNDNGKTELFGLKRMINDSNFLDKVQNVAIIFDAEKNAKNSFDVVIRQCQKANELSAALIKNGGRAAVFNLPEKIAEFPKNENLASQPNLSVFLLDKGDGTGALEDFYLSTLDDGDKSLIRECVDEKLIECLTKKQIKISAQKIKTQTFLAIKDPSWKSIGYVASKGKIDFEKTGSLLDSLRKFLTDFSQL